MTTTRHYLIKWPWLKQHEICLSSTSLELQEGTPRSDREEEKEREEEDVEKLGEEQQKKREKSKQYLLYCEEKCFSHIIMNLEG